MTGAISRRPALLLVGDTLDLGGTEGQFTELACRLDRSRWDLEVACVRPEGPLLNRLESAGLRPWRCGPPSYKSPLLLGAIVALARRLKARRIDVLHSFGFYSNILALPAARLARVRAAVGSQRDLGNLRPPGEQMLRGFALRLATNVVVNSESVKERIVEAHGVRSSGVTVIPNGVDLARFSPGQEKARVGDGLLVGAVSNLRPEKGLADLIRAVSLARGRGREVRLVIHGEGSMRKDLEAMVAGLSLGPWVSLPGSTREPEVALRELDAFVLPSLSEACSNGLMEAMATGLPVIATDVGGNPDLVQHELTGLLVPPGDAPALAEAIVRLADGRALAAGLGERARTHAHSAFGMDGMVARMDELYARLLVGA
jgi:glycosyltransferase involved in cell wall biosynthesis